MATELSLSQIDLSAFTEYWNVQTASDIKGIVLLCVYGSVGKEAAGKW